jgi:hypothetical protein
MGAATTSRVPDGSRATARRERPARKRFRSARRRLGSLGLRLFAPGALALLARTWRTEILGAENLAAAERHPGRLLALWHGRMLVPFPHHRGAGMCVLVSPSDDGSLAVPLLERYGQRVVRGSTNKASARALRELLGELERGGTVVITPDGPRGPRHSMNEGLAWLARATGFPVLPCGFVCDRAWTLRSWDRFTIPKPRARLALVYGEPLFVAERGPEVLAEATAQIRRRMLAAEARGFQHLGVTGDLGAACTEVAP